MVHFIASLGVACLQIMTLPNHDCFVLFIPGIQSQKAHAVIKVPTSLLLITLCSGRLAYDWYHGCRSMKLLLMHFEFLLLSNNGIVFIIG